MTDIRATTSEQPRTLPLALELRERYNAASSFVMGAIKNCSMKKRREIATHLKIGLQIAQTDLTKGVITIKDHLIHDLWEQINAVTIFSVDGVSQTKYMEDFAIMATTFPVESQKILQQTLVDTICPPHEMEPQSNNRHRRVPPPVWHVSSPW